ncbi:MAG TPA: nucleoside triphosphate pyrophosphohydrolase [Microlunatus sp.]
MIQGKLVRDRIPEIIESKGEVPVSRQLTDEEYEPALLSKLFEESQELALAGSRQERLEEAADVYEVLAAIAAVNGFSLAEVEAAAEQKRAERGGFQKKIWLDSW